MNLVKKIVAFLCALSVVSTGIILGQAEVKAAEVVTTVEYESLNMADYWSSSEKKVPIKQGYVFGGWYSKKDGAYTALNAQEIPVDSNGKTTLTGTYAKFVPAQVLSVKAQNASGTAANDGKRASVRVISAIDSTDYQKVGFNILINNKNKLLTDAGEELETTQIYERLNVEGDSNSPYSAQDIFGEPAQYLSVWRLDNIADQYDAKIINVTPYWITKDGTKVEGLSKYVHIEDGYKGYLSVPIHLCATQDVAAGKVTITYPTGLKLVEDKVEFDGVFPKTETTCYDNKNGTIKIVGNAATVDEYNTGNSILANLRFTVDPSVYPGAGKGVFLTFTVSDEEFCNWKVEPVDADVWDVQY